MTEANSRMARLETDPVLREEAETIRIMTAMYCRDRTVRRSPSAPSAASIVIAQRRRRRRVRSCAMRGRVLRHRIPCFPSGIL